MFDDPIDYDKCITEHPHVIQQVLTMTYHGQTKLYELSKSTGKVVKGTGIIPKDEKDLVPSNCYPIMKMGNITMYIQTKITTKPVSESDLAEMKDFITKVEALNSKWPNITGSQLAELDICAKLDEIAN